MAMLRSQLSCISYGRPKATLIRRNDLSLRVNLARCNSAVTPHESVTGAAEQRPNVFSKRQALQLAIGTAILTGIAGRVDAKAPSVVDIDDKGVRDVFTTSTGLRYSELQTGTGTITKTGDLVLVDIVGRLENGKVFLDTRKIGTPLAFEVGTTNKFIPEGLSQVVEGMTSGSVRLAVLPPELAYGPKSVSMPGGVTVPSNAKLYYEVELLRCQSFELGLACCTETSFTSNGGTCLGKKAASNLDKPVNTAAATP